MAYQLPEDSFVAWSQVVRNKGEQRCCLQDAGCRFESRTCFSLSETFDSCPVPSAKSQAPIKLPPAPTLTLAFLG